MNFEVTIPESFHFSWDSQVVQYPTKGPIGIGYFAGETDYGVVHCLLYRSTKGEVVGILNYYDESLKPNPHEEPGNVNVWVHPDRQRQGIGTALIRRAVSMWPGIDLDQQRFTRRGAAFAEHLREDGIL